MIYGHGSDDVGKFSFVPKLPYLSPYPARGFGRLQLWRQIRTVGASAILPFWISLLRTLTHFVLCK